jgi:hypothetical protein
LFSSRSRVSAPRAPKVSPFFAHAPAGGMRALDENRSWYHGAGVGIPVNAGSTAEDAPISRQETQMV